MARRTRSPGSAASRLTITRVIPSRSWCRAERTAVRSPRRSRSGSWSAFSRWTRQIRSAARLARAGPKAESFPVSRGGQFQGRRPGAGDGDEENASSSTAQVTESADMAKPGDAPDVEPEADARGRVQNAPRAGRVVRAQPVATPTPQRPRNFFERLFSRPRPAAPTPTPARRAAAGNS